jgi:hypothetical protein
MDTFPKYDFPSINEMKAMAFINENGNTMTFCTQKVYANKISFKRAMKHLFLMGALCKEQETHRPFICRYHLTPDGKVFIEGLRK